MKLIIPGLPPSPNALASKHWTKRSAVKKEWESAVAQAVVDWYDEEYYGLSGLEKAHVSFMIYTGDNRRHDPDNLAWSVTKPSMDALVTLGILKDDSIEHVTLAYEFSRDKPRRFEITIEEVK